MSQDAHNPPATLEWRRLGENLYVTEYDGSPWTLAAHSSDKGKAGWSGTNEWHLHEGDKHARHSDEGRWLCPAGRGTRFHKTKLVRAQTLAAWIVANQETAAAMTMDRIEDTVLGNS